MGSKPRYRLLAYLLGPIFLTGCMQWKPLEVPEDFKTRPEFSRLNGGPFTPGRYARAFPHIERFTMSGKVLAEPRYFFIHFPARLLNLTLAADRARGIRVRGSKQITVFDLIVHGNQLTVHLPTQKGVFSGALGPEGSPFRRAIGLEPWNLVPMIDLGRRLGTGGFHTSFWPWSRSLRPSRDERRGDGLVKVTLDRATGLPRRAVWKMGNVTLKVQYLAWGLFSGSRAEGAIISPLPTHFLIRSNRPPVRIEVRRNPSVRSPQYRINPDLPAESFELPNPPGTRTGTLDELEAILRANLAEP